VSILDQNFAPSPRQELSTSPGFIAPTPDFKGNAIVSNLKDLAGAFDKTYVARLQLAAQQKRQDILDQRFEATQKHSRGRALIADKRFEATQKHTHERELLADKRFSEKQARQQILDEQQKYSRAITNKLRNAQLTSLATQDASRKDKIRTQKEQNAVFNEFRNKGTSILPEQQDGESDMAYYQRARHAVQTMNLSPQQLNAALGIFDGSDIGRRGAAATQAYTKDLSEYRKAANDARVTGAAIANLQRRMATVVGIDPASVAQATPAQISALASQQLRDDTDPKFKQYEDLVKEMSKLQAKFDVARATAQTVADGNADVRSRTGAKTSAQVIAEHNAALAAQKAEAERLAQHTAALTDTVSQESSIEDALTGYVQPDSAVQAAKDRAQGVPGAMGVSLSDISAAQAGTILRERVVSPIKEQIQRRDIIDKVGKEAFNALLGAYGNSVSAFWHALFGSAGR